MGVTSAIVLFAVTAVVYSALTAWRLTFDRGRAAARYLALALALGGMAVWAMGHLIAPVTLVIGEAVRNALWCAYLAFMAQQDRALIPQKWIERLPIVLIALELGRTVLLLTGAVPGNGALLVFFGGALLFCVGALILLYSLFVAAHRAASGFRLLIVALAILWLYDLNAYAAMLLRFAVAEPLFQGRALVALLLVPIFGIAARRKEHWSLSPSRRLTFQSLSLVVIGSYVTLLSAIATARPWLGDTIQVVAAVVLVLVLLGGAVAFFTSPRVRAIVRVFVSKHLFKHRYDYRGEWLRFNATINSGALTGLRPEQRAIKALADIMEASGGLLYLTSGHDRLVREADYDLLNTRRFPDEITIGQIPDHGDAQQLILVAPPYRDADDLTFWPHTLPSNGDVWLAVPLEQMGVRIGLAVLGRARIARRLDWEDFDLLRVLGQQIATYVADARRQTELEQARQFDEFNRRFAFIVHDIKNVVSQLSLVTANAEEHAENPRFRADMMATLHNSVSKMTTLLSRLTPKQAEHDGVTSTFDATALLHQIAAARQAQHVVLVAASDHVAVTGDAAKLATAIDHLVQNAIEASTQHDDVVLSAHARDGWGVISIVDNGAGMSADFMRTNLFKPFASTKPTGFGIGASEAQSLIRQMDGVLEVQSVVGVGTSFIVSLPLGKNEGTDSGG